MKNISIVIKSFFVFMATTLSFSLFAQKDSSGVFKTGDDFVKGNFTLGASTFGEKNKFRLNELIGTHNLDVIHQGKKYTFRKNDIWGFQYNPQNVYRIYKEECYRLEEQGPITIYSRTTDEAEGKSIIVLKEYYFSPKIDGDLQPLTVDRLKRTFADNHKFLEAIETRLKESDPAEYDSYFKSFKVNYLYGQTLAQK